MDNLEMADFSRAPSPIGRFMQCAARVLENSYGVCRSCDGSNILTHTPREPLIFSFLRAFTGLICLHAACKKKKRKKKEKVN